MNKSLIQVLMLFVATLTTANLSAQNQVNMRVFNQYEAPADKFTVDGVEYATTKDGTITLNVNATDSVTFAGKEYDAKKYAVADLKDGMTIELYKQFTWKDILNPMFYIKYGGLWLL